jgi:hypothetical protein
MLRSHRINRILRACARDWATPAAALPALVAGHDLSGLLQAADDHRLVGCVRYGLQGLEGVHQPTAAAVEERYHAGVAAHLRTLADLAHLRAIVAPGRVPWLVVRGPVLAEDCYQLPGLRIYSLTEILVAPQTVPEFLRILATEVRHAAGGAALQGTQGQMHLQLRYGTVVGLRWRLAPGSIPVDDLFARAREISLGGTAVTTPSVEDTVVLLAVHAAIERPWRLGYLKDIAMTIRAGTPDWRAVIARSAAWGVGGLVGAALRRTRAVAGADVPEDVTSRMLAPDAPAVLPSPTARVARTPVPAPPDGEAAALYRLIRVDGPGVPDDNFTGWDTVLQTAGEEQVAQLVWSVLRGLPSRSSLAVPQAVLGYAHRGAEERADDAYRQLAEILRALRQNGLKTVIMKGAGLARFTYADPALRPFGDLDLLIRPEDIDPTHRVLGDLGYTIFQGAPSEVDRKWRHGRGYFDLARRRLPIDVHWRYSGYPNLLRFDPAGVFARAIEVSVNGEPALIEAPCDAVVAATIYFLREMWYGKAKMRYVRDLAEIAHRRPVDWDQVLQRVEEEPLLRSPLRVAMGSAAALLGAAVPAAVLTAVAPKRWGRAAVHLDARIRDNLLRRETAFEAVCLVALMRWFDGDAIGNYLRWARSMVLVPPPFAASRRRWLRRML